jgi:hypothetical protein
MAAQPEISPRDVRTRSTETTDAVQGGQAFPVALHEPQIGKLPPSRSRRRFVARGELLAMSRVASDVSLDRFRVDQDAVTDQDPSDPYGR